MVTVSEARDILAGIASVTRLQTKMLALENLLGHTLAEDIHSRVFSPPFDQAAMDGYAVCAEDLGKRNRICVIGENPAGNYRINQLRAGQCIRIYTGAKIPAGTGAVIQQEHVQVAEDGSVLFDPGPIKAGDHIREKGSDFKKGDLILKKGQKLNTHTITLLAASGHTKVKVYAKPRVSILVTGSELVRPGKRISGDKIIETNSLMLKMALKSMGHPDVEIFFAPDKVPAIEKLLLQCLKNSRVVLLSGGISVGKYDLAHGSLVSAGVKTRFYKIKQKPGKPLYFGQYKKCFLFGLPGNPAASLTCFYEYVAPFLRTLSGETASALPIRQAKVVNGYQKKAGLSNFLKARLLGPEVELLNGQESYKISSFNGANCLVYLAEETTHIERGQTVECHLLPVYD